MLQLFRFPTEIDGSSSTYMCDYYWQNLGVKSVCVCGDFGSNYMAGLWYFNLNNSFINASWNIGCRVLIYGKE